MHKYGLDLLSTFASRPKLDDLNVPPQLVHFVFDVAEDMSRLEFREDGSQQVMSESETVAGVGVDEERDVLLIQ